MKHKKKSSYKNQLKELRSELMGNIGQTIKTSKKEETTQTVPDLTDSATQSSDSQLILKLGEQGWEKLKLVDEALERLESNQFGFCLQCEKSIPEARLDLVPFAQYCVECLEQIEDIKKRQNEAHGE